MQRITWLKFASRHERGNVLVLLSSKETLRAIQREQGKSQATLPKVTEFLILAFS